VFHLDRIYWKPGWVQTPKDEWWAIQEELVKRDSWIADGNYGGSQHIRFSAADTIIYMDYSRLICVWRVIKRSLSERFLGRTRPDLGPGCRERIGLDFLGFLKWIWEFNARNRPRVLERLSRYGEGKEIVVLRRPADVESFISDIAARRRVVQS